MRPSPYRVPGYVLHTRTHTKIAFDPESARKLMENETEFLLQRFVVGADFIARKLRVEWNSDKRLHTMIIERQSPMPFNAPRMPEVVGARRKFSVFATLNAQDRPRRRSQLLPAPVPLHPDLFTTKEVKAECEDRAWEKDYLVSFKHMPELTVKEVGLFDRVPDAETILAFFHPENSGVFGLKLCSMTLDLLQAGDGRWAFLSLKKLKYRETGVSVKPQTQKSLDDIMASLAAGLPAHRAPAINLEEIQSQNIALYLRLHNS